MSTLGENDTAGPVGERPSRGNAAGGLLAQAMSEEFTTSDPLEVRRAWLRSLIAEFIKLGPLLPLKLYGRDESTPKWVQNVEREIGAAMLPIARVKDEQNLSPRKMGGFIGHAFAYCKWMVEYIEAEIKRLLDQEFKMPELTPEQIRIGKKFIKLTAALHRLARRGLCSSLEQPFDDANEFIMGYAEAFSKKPKTRNASDIGNSATQIYFFMFILWRAVHSMQSVRQLHEWLVKAFGPYRVGDLKRVEKMCQRIELHYRKPGRPKQAK